MIHPIDTNKISVSKYADCGKMMNLDYAHVRMLKSLAMPQYTPSRQSTMVTVKLRCNGKCGHDITVSWGTSLRDVQEHLCSLFHKPFPATKVCLGLNGKMYDEFMEKAVLGL